jgi:hypothetical protein
MLQRLAFQQFHGDERLLFVLPDIVDGADVWMIQSRGGACFSLKAVESLAVSGHLGGKEFQGNMPAKASVLGFVDHTHAPATQTFQNSIVRDGLTEHWLG